MAMAITHLLTQRQRSGIHKSLHAFCGRRRPLTNASFHIEGIDPALYAVEALFAPVSAEAVANRPVVQPRVCIGAPADQGDHVGDAWVLRCISDDSAGVVLEAIGVRVHCTAHSQK